VDIAVPIVGAPGTVRGVTCELAVLETPVPAEFVAVAVNVYAWPFVNPATETEGPAPDPVIEPGLEVTVYDVTDAPPVSVGVLTGTLTLVVEPEFVAENVGVPTVGAPGTVIGVTDDVGELFAPVPLEFVAVAVNVYACPFVSPETVIDGPAPDPVIDPGLEVAEYPVIVFPPVSTGAFTTIVTFVVEP
jgi:hypothetical protein